MRANTQAIGVWTLLSFVIAAVVCACVPDQVVAASACSTESGAIADEPPLPLAEQMLARLREAYSTTSVRERVTVTYRRRDSSGESSAGERRRTSVLFVQTQPARRASADTAAQPGRAWIRASNLRVWTEGLTVRAASDAADSPVLEQVLTDAGGNGTGDGAGTNGPANAPDSLPKDDAGATATTQAVCVDSAMLARVLPPLPVPQLDLWCLSSRTGTAGDPAAVQRLTPYARDIRWTGASRDAKVGTIEVSGVCEGGTIVVACVEKTSRLRRVTIELVIPSPVSIIMEFQPEAVGGASSGASRDMPPMFEIDVGTRRRVNSLRELSLSARHRVTDSGLSWSGVQTLDGLSAAGFLKSLPEANRPRLVLMVRARPGEDSLPPLADAILERLRARSQDADKAQPLWIVMSVCTRAGRAGGTGGAGTGDGNIGAGGVDEKVLDRVEAWAAILKPHATALRGQVLWTCEPKWAADLAPNDEPLAWVALRPDQTMISHGVFPDPDAAEDVQSVENLLDTMLKTP